MTLKQAERAKRLRRLQQIASLMDDRYRIPGTGIRLGWDSIVGLLPGIGDALSMASFLVMLWHAQKLEVGRGVQLRMAANALVDVAVGWVPLLGDVFDVYWKSNRRNMRLLEQAVERAQQRSTPPPRLPFDPRR